MFAVPGWSISADKLKTEIEEAPKKNRKKRKRGNDVEIDRNIDSSNVAELWKRHVEGKGGASKTGEYRKTKRGKEKVKREHDLESVIQPNESNGEEGAEQASKESNEALERNKKKRKRKDQDKPNKDEVKAPIEITASSAPVQLDLPQLPPPSTLTPLQAKMRQKLIGSRFRYLNETLYTTPSSSSKNLFNDNPGFFNEYHEGFRRQVSTWPENPVDGFVKWLLERGKIRFKSDNNRGKLGTSKKHKTQKQFNPQDASTFQPLDPLPRSGSRPGWCSIVDLGCGDAKLAQAVQDSASRSSAPHPSKLDVKSFDLAASNSFVTVADIRSLPLPDASVDVAIFCLALMGTNWVDFVEEAYRVLRWKGECWVAEVASRFGAPKRERGRVEHSVGNKVREKGGKKLKGKGVNAGEEEDESRQEELGLVEPVTAQPQTGTDVSAFVDVLTRRGFVLQGAPETGNKMFVRMRFVKAAPAVRGKCVKKEEPGLGKKPKFINEDDGQITVEDEAKVLKPCVYKTR